MTDVFDQEKLFGSRLRTEVLILVALLEDTYASELAAISGRRLYSVQRVVDGLERERVLVGRVSGRERRIQFNPRLPYRRELMDLLRRMADSEQRLTEAVNQIRRRPRRKGKEL